MELTGDRYMPKAGSPLSMDALHELSRAINPDIYKVSAGFLDHRQQLIHYHFMGNHTIIWRFSPPDSALPGWINHLVSVPDMIFYLNHHALRTYFITAADTDANMQLYHPYLPNISADGIVCLGNAKHCDSSDMSEVMNHYQEMFFNTRFNQMNNNISKKDAKTWWSKWEQRCSMALIESLPTCGKLQNLLNHANKNA